MGIDGFIEDRAVKRSFKKAKKGTNDFRLPYGGLLSHESLRNVHTQLTNVLGGEGVKWFLYTVRAYNHEDGPLRVHISHRGDNPTSTEDQEPHSEYGASLKPKFDNPNYVYKIINPHLIADAYDPSEFTHRKDDDE